MIKKVLNEKTNRMVYDDKQCAAWRKTYYKKVEDAKGESWMQMTNAIQAARLSGIHLLGTKEIAEYFRFSQGTAYKYMREQIIPSFYIGKRLFTHDYVVDTIEKKVREFIGEGYACKLYPRIVWKHDQGIEW